MNIALSGANGFIGTQIRENFKSFASEILILKRNDPDDVLKDIISKADVIINLAGSPIFKRWNLKNRKIILESRVKSTQRIVTMLNNLPKNSPPKLLISNKDFHLNILLLKMH
jgi:NAD dependent epimerase/dehydratase family enzyme